MDKGLIEWELRKKELAMGIDKGLIEWKIRKSEVDRVGRKLKKELKALGFTVSARKNSPMSNSIYYEVEHIDSDKYPKTIRVSDHLLPSGNTHKYWVSS